MKDIGNNLIIVSGMLAAFAFGYMARDMYETVRPHRSFIRTFDRHSGRSDTIDYAKSFLYHRAYYQGWDDCLDRKKEGYEDCCKEMNKNEEN